MVARNSRLEGVVVGRKDFGESDRVIVIFTERQGKVGALAKGVRKITSRRLGALELGNQIKALVHHGKSFDIITEVEVVDDCNVRRDAVRLGGIIFLSELVNSLLPEGEKNPGIYQEFLRVRNLVKIGRVEEVVFFEANLLRALGYGLDNKIEELLKSNNLRQAHMRLKERIETIIEQPLKSLAIFG